MVNKNLNVIISMVLVGVLVGCGDSSPEESLGDIELAWQSAVDDNDDLQNALERLYKNCMEDKGFDAHPATLGAWENTNYASEIFDSYLSRLFPPRDVAAEVGMESSPKESIEDRINDLDEDDMPIDVVGDDARTEYGRLSYGDRSRYNQALVGYLYSEADEAEASGASALPNHEVIVLEGGTEIQYPTVGCKAEVHEDVFGDAESVEEYYELKGYVIDLWPRYASNEVNTDPKFLSAESDWIACMEENGIGDLGSVQDMVSVLGDLWQPAYEGALGEAEWNSLKEQEIDVVLTHLDCASEADLPDTMERIHSEAGEEFMIDHEVEFFAWRDLVEASMVNVQELL